METKDGIKITSKGLFLSTKFSAAWPSGWKSSLPTGKSSSARRQNIPPGINFGGNGKHTDEQKRLRFYNFSLLSFDTAALHTTYSGRQNHSFPISPTKQQAVLVDTPRNGRYSRNRKQIRSP